MRSAVFAVVVARAGAGAKSRLAAVLAPEQRHALVLAMLADVLAVCHATPALHGVIAVTQPSLALDARTLRVDDPAEGDMNAAVCAGIAAAVARGAETAIVLPADIPCLSTADFSALLAAAGDHVRAVVIGSSRDGQGTNALLLRPPNAIAPSFGPPSAERHRALAEAAGCHTLMLPDLTLSLDIDTPQDLHALRSARDLPPRTAAFVATLGQGA